MLNLLPDTLNVDFFTSAKNFWSSASCSNYTAVAYSSLFLGLFLALFQSPWLLVHKQAENMSEPQTSFVRVLQGDTDTPTQVQS